MPTLRLRSGGLLSTLDHYFVLWILAYLLGCSPNNDPTRKSAASLDSSNVTQSVIDPTQSINASYDSGESGLQRLRQMKMENVTPVDGFAYFSGHFHGIDDFGPDLPTMYYTAGFDPRGPRLVIVAPGLQLEYSINRIDEALQIYKLICLQRAALWTSPEDILALGNAIVQSFEGKNNILERVPESKLKAFLRREIKFQELFKGLGSDQLEIKQP